MQILLFPDPKPLVERLGAEFFRNIPQEPGVYFMDGHTDTVLYVGKARNLRKRLSSYRVANVDRLPRRTVRLLHLVERIRWESCATETAAIAREAELLRALKPRFNRAGVWPPKPRQLHFRSAPSSVELFLADSTQENWDSSIPVGGGADYFFQALARALWRLSNPTLPTCAMPEGWFHGWIPNPVNVPHPQPLPHNPGPHTIFTALFSNNPSLLLESLRSLAEESTHPFELAAINADIETLEGFLPESSGHSALRTPDSALPLPASSDLSVSSC